MIRRMGQGMRRVNGPAFVLGVLSMTGQIIVLREFLTVFTGNELAYAVTLAAWLTWVAVGSLAYGRWPHRRGEAAVTGMTVAAAVSLPVLIVALRAIRTVLGVPAGQIVGVVWMAGPAFVLLAPLGLLLGAIYAALCQRIAVEQGAVRQVSGIYLSEALGAAAGGIVVSLVLIRFLPAIQIALLLTTLLLALAAGWARPRGRMAAGWAVALLLAVTMIFFGARLDRWSRRLQWPGLDLAAVTDSVYGNLALIRTGPEYSLYENGALSFATGERWSVEERIHLPLLAHPAPGRVLLIGSGLDGSLAEILKHPVRSVDYVELDPAAQALASGYLTDGQLAPLRDPRVRVFFTDARLWVKQGRARYDVVIVNLPDPENALLNRYYTRDFFEEVRRILTPQGVLSLCVSSSENYINPETRRFLRSINTTLRSVFAAVHSIPGDSNIFVAAVSPGGVTVDAQALLSRLRARGITADYVSEAYLPFKLSADRLAEIRQALAEPGQLNTDLHPIAYLYDILLWSTHFNNGFRAAFARLQGLRLVHLLFLPLAVCGLGIVTNPRRRLAGPVAWSIVTTGISEIVFQLLVILAFQTLYGYVYYQLGMIMAAFMAGLVWGSWRARSWTGLPLARQWGIYRRVQFLIMLYPLSLPLAFMAFRDVLGGWGLPVLFAGSFATLPMLAGFLGGAQYPLAVSLRRAEDGAEGVSRDAGWLYGLDVLGAAAGALITGSVLIPIIGIDGVAYLFAALNAAIWLLLLRARGPLAG